MDTQNLKIKVLKKIIELDDLNTLKSLDIILNSTDETILNFLDLALDQTQNNDFKETEDYTNYIKEWVKNM